MANKKLKTDLDNLTDEEKYELAEEMLASVDNFDGGIVTTDPDVTDPDDVENAKELIKDFNENLKERAIEVADSEHFKYAEELNLFRKKVEDYSDEIKDHRVEDYALKVVIEDNIDETWQELEQSILSSIKDHFSDDIESDKISNWFRDHKMRSPEEFRDMKGRKYQWETMARAVEYMQDVASRLVENLKSNVQDLADELYRGREWTPLIKQTDSLDDAHKVVSVIQSNPELAELAEQPGVFWSWFIHIDSPSAAYDAEVKDVTNFVKCRCNAYGRIRPAAWKYLTKLHRPVMSNIVDGGYSSSMPDIPDNLLFNLSEAGVRPGGSLVENIISHVDDTGYFNWTSQSPTAILRACWRHWEEEGGGEAIWQDIISVLDWAENARPELDHNQQTAPWNWFIERSATWHEEEGNTGYSRYADFRWNTLIDQVEIENYFVVALTSSDDLDEEGNAMSHCVNRYDKKCIRNDSRVFSIRKDPNDTETTVATLEIRREGSKWDLKQVRGKSNKRVNASMKRIARKLKDLYVQSWNAASEPERIESLQYQKIE